MLGLKQLLQARLGDEFQQTINLLRRLHPFPDPLFQLARDVNQLPSFPGSDRQVQRIVLLPRVQWQPGLPQTRRIVTRLPRSKAASAQRFTSRERASRSSAGRWLRGRGLGDMPI